MEYRRKTALITGASSGIGEAFARDLAAKGMNLILVARSEDKLRRLAKALQDEYNIQAEVIVADLSKEASAQMVFDAVELQEQQVDLLIEHFA